MSRKGKVREELAVSGMNIGGPVWLHLFDLVKAFGHY